MKRFVAGPVFCALLIASEGCEEDHQEECSDICNRLSLCGLLPSILGVDISSGALNNCKERCYNSTDELRQSIASCLVGVDPDYGPTSQTFQSMDAGADAGVVVDFNDTDDETRYERELWCKRPTEDKPAVCELAAQCLTSEIGAGTLGLGLIRISTTTGMHPNLKYAFPSPDQEQCILTSPCCEQPPESSPVPSNPCRNFGVDEVEFFVDRMGERITVDAQRVGCFDQLGHTVEQTLPAGRVTAGVKLTGVFPDPEDLEAPIVAPSGEYCWNFYAPTAVVRSDEEVNVFIHLPTMEELLRYSAIERREWPELCEDPIDETETESETKVDSTGDGDAGA